MQKKRGSKPLDPVPSSQAGCAETLIEAHLDVAGAVALHADLLAALSRGAVRVALSEGKPTQPAIQLLVAARNSARSGHDVSFDDAAAAVLGKVIEEGV
jgi:hypothetical protein